MAAKKYPRTWILFLLVAIRPLTTDAQILPGISELRFALVFSRHGVRSPTKPNCAYAEYAVDCWPKWPVSPGCLTVHGKELMALLGKFYQAYFKQEGQPHVYLRRQFGAHDRICEWIGCWPFSALPSGNPFATRMSDRPPFPSGEGRPWKSGSCKSSGNACQCHWQQSKCAPCRLSWAIFFAARSAL
jgi:hypothetical protein